MHLSPSLVPPFTEKVDSPDFEISAAYPFSLSGPYKLLLYFNYYYFTTLPTFFS